MDYVLITLAILLVLAGVLGCIVPALPGPPLSYIGLLLLHLTERYHFDSGFLILWGIITVFVYGLDIVIPIWGTKKFGGSKRGVWGSIIGLLIGMFIFFPFGIIIGPFAGAVIGELTSGKDSGEALRSGFGSFLGLITGTVLKLVTSGMLTYFFAKELFSF